MKAKRKTETAVEIHKGDVWRFKQDPARKVVVVDQTDRAVVYRQDRRSVSMCDRSGFLLLFELVSRTKKWSPAAEGKPR